MICSVCQTTLQAAISHFRIAKEQDERCFVRATPHDEPDGEYIEDHHKTWNDFMESFNQQCHICSKIRMCINETEERNLDILWQKIATGKIPNAYGNAASQLLLAHRRHQDYQCFTFRFRILSMPKTSDRQPDFLDDDLFRQCPSILC